MSLVFLLAVAENLKPRYLMWNVEVVTAPTFRSLYHDMSTAASKASSPQNAI
jgi:hypothetical protein